MDNTSYGQILKSTALVGSSSAMSIAVRIVRAKAMAILLGPAGVGLVGMYGSIVDLSQSIIGLGVSSSGVRQVADAAASNDFARISRTTAVLRLTSILLGAVGAILVFSLSKQISALTFGNTHSTAAISFLSIAVFLNLVSAGQTALLQGLRRIGDLAKIAVLSAVSGAISSIVLVYLLHNDGVAPALVATSVIGTGTSWWYSRNIQIKESVLSVSLVWQEASILLRLGLAFLASGLMMIGSGYVIRITALHTLGIESTGLYQSAWTLGGLYVGLILQGMGADFYPRLTASVSDNKTCNRLVNEQTRVSLLLAGPGVIATLTFSPFIVALFYSSSFSSSVDLLRWICLGIAFRVISWPIGFLIVAKGEQGLYFWSELAWTVIHIGLAFVLMTSVGLNGAGMAFFGSYIFHSVIVYSLTNRLTGFTWSTDNKRLIVLYLSVIALTFAGFHIMPSRLATLIGSVAIGLSCVYSSRILLTLVPVDRIPPVAQKFLRVTHLLSVPAIVK